MQIDTQGGVRKRLRGRQEIDESIQQLSKKLSQDSFEKGESIVDQSPVVEKDSNSLRKRDKGRNSVKNADNKSNKKIDDNSAAGIEKRKYYNKGDKEIIKDESQLLILVGIMLVIVLLFGLVLMLATYVIKWRFTKA